MGERNTDSLLRTPLTRPSPYEVQLTHPSNSRIGNGGPFPPPAHSVVLDTLLLREEQDDWNFPVDHRGQLCKRTFGVVESLAIITIVVYSIVILIHENLYQTQKNLFYFVVAVLLSDVAVLSIAGVILCFTCCTGGYQAVKSSIGLFIQTSRAAACYVFLGYGIYFLYKYQQDLYENHLLLLGYIIAVTSVMAVYSIASCPTVLGTLGFLGHKIWLKIIRHPLVEFHQPSRPSWFTYYFGVDRLGQHLRDLNRPSRGREYMPGRRSRGGAFDEPMFQRGDEVGTLTETPLEELLQKMGLDEKAEAPNEVQTDYKRMGLS